jgi:hypothetical protein
MHAGKSKPSIRLAIGSRFSLRLDIKPTTVVGDRNLDGSVVAR